MTLGELNYESDFIPDVKLHYPLAANAVFVFFCLAMPIILMNMLVSNLFVVIYQIRETVFHRDIQTPRRELKIRRAAEYF